MTDGSRQQWLHGFLDLCLLGLLVRHRDYGLGLAQGLAAAGLGDVPGGTLYPSLLRLEKQGLVDTVWERSTAGPPRKYYQVTTTGRESFAERSDEWRRFRGALDSLTDMADDRASGNAS